MSTDTTATPPSTAVHFLDGLVECGVEHVFANFGTDHVALIVRLPDVRERMALLGIEAEGGTAEEFAKVIATEIPLWAALAKANNIKAD